MTFGTHKLHRLTNNWHDASVILMQAYHHRGYCMFKQVDAAAERYTINALNTDVHLRHQNVAFVKPDMCPQQPGFKSSGCTICTGILQVQIYCDRKFNTMSCYINMFHIH